MKITDYNINIARGSYGSDGDGGMCIMDYIANSAGEFQLCGKPKSVDETIAKFCRILNDALDSSGERKEYFLPVISLVKNTNSKSPITNQRRNKLWREIVNSGFLANPNVKDFHKHILKLRHCDTTLEYLDEKVQSAKVINFKPNTEVLEKVAA